MCKGKSVNYLLIELPEYKLPDAHTVAIYVFEKVKDYLEKAGTTIFLATIIIWLVLNFGPSGLVSDMGDSFGAYIGKILVPIFMPIGLGFWQVVVALIAGISAKEVVVSSMAVLFGIVNASSASGMMEFTSALSGIGFTSLNALKNKIKVLYSKEDNISAICSRFLYIRYLLNKGYIPIDTLKDTASMMTTRQYDEEEMEKLIKKLEIYDFVSSLLYVMHEKANLTEGFMPIQSSNNRLSETILNRIIQS